MRITGVITEYNPFHNGHFYHLQQTRLITKPDLLVAVMSGNFVQRGEPAIMDKWTRTQMALTCGADIVVELPTVFACHSAAEFASGAMRMLGTCAADTFVFGAENDDLTELAQVAELLNTEPPQYKKTLRSFLDKGYSFVSARAKAAAAVYPPAEHILRASNNILAINYLLALKRYQLQLKPQAIARQGAAYNDANLSSAFSSATALREALLLGKNVRAFIPEPVYPILQSSSPVTWSDFSQSLLMLLRRSTVEELNTYPDMEIGLANRLKKHAYQVDSIDDFIAAIACKRYPLTRIKRILTRLLLGINNEIAQTAKKGRFLPYIRLLGLRRAASDKLKMWRNLAYSPVVQQPARYVPAGALAQTLWDVDLRATDLYALGYQKQSFRCKRQDFCHPLVIV